MRINSRSAKRAARTIAGLLSLAIWISSFGPSAAHAAGSVAGKAAPKAGAPAALRVPALTTPLSTSLSNRSAVPGLSGGALPTLETPVPALDTHAAPAPVASAGERAPTAPPAARKTAAARTAQQDAAPAPAPADAIEKETRPARTVKGRVAQAVARLAKAGPAGVRARILNGLYLGSPLGAGNGADSGPVDGSRGDRRSSRAELKKRALGELVFAATTPKSTLESRKAAVRVLSKIKSEEGRAALETVADSNPEGGAADYEVHRAALRALDENFGILRSLRPISQAHKDEILARFRSDKPEMVLSDYDRTLASTKADISAEMAEALAAVPNAGVEIALLTDRPAAPRYEGDVTIFQSLASMTPVQKRKLSVLSDKGAKTSIFDRNGEPVLIHEETFAWSAADRAILADASKALRERFGDQDFLGNAEVYERDEYERFLPASLTDAEIAEAGRIADAVLAKGGLAGVHIVARRPFGAGEVPYVRISMTDKSAASARIRKDVRRLERARDAARFGGGSRAIRFLETIASRFSKRPVSARNTVLIGDSFMPEAVAPGSDALMAKGSPGATTLAVAGVASPRIDNAFVWPTTGETASLEILNAIGEPTVAEVDKKGVAGLFAQRTIAITTYILTTIAFTAIAVPVIGWVGYGSVMAVGSLAPIAVGPLNGWIVDKLSARNSMALNTAARVVLDFLPPALVLLGMVNTPTLILAAIANFWILSSVMTTEGAYIKRLAGKKYVGPVNSLLWMNYLVVQVVLALILGFGAVVGIVGPVNAYFIAAAINAFVIMPIVWFTMPNQKPIPKSLLAIENEIKRIDAIPEAERTKKDSSRSTALATALGEREAALKNELVQIELAIQELAAERQAAEDPRRLDAIETELRVLLNDRRAIKNELARAVPERLSHSERVAKLRAAVLPWFKRYGVGFALLGASILSYFAVWSSPVPIAVALGYLVSRTDGAKLLWAGRGRDIGKREMALVERIQELEAKEKPNQKELAAAKAELERWKKSPRIAMLYIALGALTLGPLQSFAIPRFTEAVTGLPMASPESTLLFGQYLGALFFGSLIANAAQVRLPEVQVPLFGRVQGQRFLQGLVALLAPIWVYTSLAPGSLLAAAGALAGVATLMALAAKLTNRAWLKFLGLGMAGIWLPYLAWGSAFLSPATAMFLSVVLAGGVYGPAFVSLKTIFEGSLQKSILGKMIGVQGSLLNAARSVAIGGTAALYGALNPAFPAFLAVLGGFYAAIGAAFWLAPRFFPSLPKTLLRPDERRR
jgi:hypothetical protein